MKFQSCMVGHTYLQLFPCLRNLILCYHVPCWRVFYSMQCNNIWLLCFYMKIFKYIREAFYSMQCYNTWPLCHHMKICNKISHFDTWCYDYFINDDVVTVYMINIHSFVQTGIFSNAISLFADGMVQYLGCFEKSGQPRLWAKTLLALYWRWCNNSHDRQRCWHTINQLWEHCKHVFSNIKNTTLNKTKVSQYNFLYAVLFSILATFFLTTMTS